MRFRMVGKTTSRQTCVVEWSRGKEMVMYFGGAVVSLAGLEMMAGSLTVEWSYSTNVFSAVAWSRVTIIQPDLPTGIIVLDEICCAAW